MNEIKVWEHSRRKAFLDMSVLWLLGVSLVLILFGEGIAAVSKIGIFKSADDLIILLSVIGYFLYDLLRSRTTKYVFIWIGIVIIFTLISAPSHYFKGVFVAALAALLYCKIFAFFYIANRITPQLIDKCVGVILLIHLTGFVLNLIFPNLFIPYLPDVSYELDTSRIIGFELNPNRFAAVSCILSIYYFTKNRQWIVPLILLIALLTSGSRSFLIAYFIIGYYIYTVIKGKRVLGFKIFLLMGLMVIASVFSAEKIASDFVKVSGTADGEGKYIRAAMLFSGVSLAYHFFPFGTGGGTFGSPLSLGSGVYKEVGIATWPSVISGSGIHDSGIGSLLGEYGFVGLIILTYLLFKLFSLRSLNLTKKDVYFLLILTLFLSFFRGVVSSYFYALFLFLVVYIIGRIRQGHLIKKSFKINGR